MPRRPAIGFRPFYITPTNSTRNSVRASVVSQRPSIRSSNIRLVRRSMATQKRNRLYLSKSSRGTLIPQLVAPHPFPLKMFKVLKYSQNVRLTTGAAGVAGTIQKFALNSLYDPDITGTGHQPYGRDTLAAIYNRYKINACKVVITIIDPSSDSVAVCTMVNGPSTQSDTLAGLTVEQIREKSMCSVKYINNSGSQVKKYYQKLHLADVMGVTHLQYKTDLDNTTAAMGGSPADVCSIQFAALDLRGDTSRDVVIAVDLYYMCELFERITLAQS